METMKNPLVRRRSKESRAQAIVEFMIALPLLLILIYGIVEVSRLVFIFGSVANGSRQAARYGSAAGETTNDVYYYQDCEGIRKTANRSAIITDFQEINITYDRGVTSDGTQVEIPDIDPSPDSNTCPVEDNIIRNGDRIIVQVSASYEPILPLLPIEPFTVASSSARTFLISIPIAGSSMPLEFAAESATPSKVPTSTSSGVEPTQTVPSSPTRTSAPPGGGGLTPGISITLTQLALTKQAGITPLPPTLTFTPTRTPLPTYTPSTTPTAISCTGLNGLYHYGLWIHDNIMELKIGNLTGYTLTASQVYVEWNHDTGHPSGNDHTLRLNKVQTASESWMGDIHAPSAYIPSFYPAIPPGETLFQFIFNQDYDLTDGTERIIITIGTPGCVNYPIDSRN